MKDCLQLIAGFRAYLGMESPPDGDFTWKRERTFLLAQNGSLQQENLALCKEVKLVNTRLGAMSQILALQESELSQSSCIPREVGLQRSHKSQDHPTSLLTRYVRTYICMYVRTYLCGYVILYAHVYVCLYCMHMCMSVCTVCTCVCLFVLYAHVYVCLYCMHMCMSVCTVCTCVCLFVLYALCVLTYM